MKLLLFGRGVEQNYEIARNYFKIPSISGFLESKYKLGEIYYFGHGIKQDYKKAREFFEFAANKEHTESKLKLNKCFKGS